MIKKIKYITYSILWYLLSFDLLLADNGANWIFWDKINKKNVKRWDIHLEDIPIILRNIIDILLEIAWTISLIFIIIWAYKIIFGSLVSDKNKWRDTIIMALTWFAISTLAWFIIKFIIDNFS